MTDGLDKPSNFARHLGYELMEWREDYARYEMPITDALGNRGGIPHGGGTKVRDTADVLHVAHSEWINHVLYCEGLEDQ